MNENVTAADALPKLDDLDALRERDRQRVHRLEVQVAARQRKLDEAQAKLDALDDGYVEEAKPLVAQQEELAGKVQRQQAHEAALGHFVMAASEFTDWLQREVGRLAEEKVALADSRIDDQEAQRKLEADIERVKAAALAGRGHQQNVVAHRRRELATTRAKLDKVRRALGLPTGGVVDGVEGDEAGVEGDG